MAQPATPGFIKGCIIVPLITILVLVIVVVGAGLIVLNMTPADLGIADVELFDGETLTTLGLADVKLKEIPAFIKEIMNVEEDKIVTNAPKEEDKAAAENKIAGSSVQMKEDGVTIDYSSIVTDKIIYPTKQTIEYDDTTLAYIFNQMISDGAESSDEAIEFLQEIDASINEVTISKSEEGSSLRLVASIDLTSMTEELVSALKEAGVGNFIKLPEKAYLVSYSSITINEEGLVTTSQSLKINDSDNPISKAIMKVLAKKANETAQEEGQQVDTNANVVNDKIGEAFVSIVSNLGKPVEIKDGAIAVETYTE